MEPLPFSARPPQMGTRQSNCLAEQHSPLGQFPLVLWASLQPSLEQQQVQPSPARPKERQFRSARGPIPQARGRHNGRPACNAHSPANFCCRRTVVGA